MSPETKRMARLIRVEPSTARDVLGVLVTPLVGNAETDEHFGVFYAEVPPGIGIPAHSHPDVELFFVLEGGLTLLRAPDEEPASIAAGQGGFVPAGALHGFMNPGPESARLLITCTRGLEDFLLEAGRRVSDAGAREPSTIHAAPPLGDPYHTER